MMHEFLTANRNDLIARCRAKVALRSAPEALEKELEYGVSPFLNQLIETLQAEQTAEPARGRAISGPSGGEAPGLSEIGETAKRHGRELLQHGFTVDQVVHDYGDVCQAVTDLALEREEPFDIDEFRTLNRCLDNAIADAVTEFTSQRDSVTTHKQARAMDEQIGSFAHELRRHIHSATFALNAIREGKVGMTGATGAILGRSLIELRKVVDHSLSDVRATAGMPAHREVFSLRDLIAEVRLSASLEAQMEDCELVVPQVDSQLTINGDRDLLCAALGNLLQDAFRFAHLRSEVSLKAHAVADRILIEIANNSGGLSPDDAEGVILPFVPSGESKSDPGVSIARRSIELNEGLLSVRDVPGAGRLFTIDLPRHSLAKTG